MMIKYSKTILFLFLLSSCVTSKKYNELNALNDKNLREKENLESKLDKTDASLEDCNTEKEKLKSQIAILQNEKAKLELTESQLTKELNDFKLLNKELADSRNSILNEATSNQNKLNEALIKKEKELDAISTQQAELDKKLKARELELDAIQKENEEKSKKIKELEERLLAKDNALQDLKTNIANALKGFNSEEVQVVEKQGKLYITLSENLLFKSGSFSVDSKGEEAILKLAEVLKEQNDFDIIVEGHTDNVPFKGNGQLLDNWDLSVKRATSVVRILSIKGGVDPTKIAASGRADYMPVVSNDSAENKAKNRRTEIILSPKLDKILDLLNQN